MDGRMDEWMCKEENCTSRTGRFVLLYVLRVRIRRGIGQSKTGRGGKLFHKE